MTQKKLKIGIYDPYLDDCGGGEKYMMTIAECLSQNNDVNVFWDSQKDFDAVFERFNLDSSKIERVANIFLNHTSILKKFRSTKNYDALIVLSDGSIPVSFSKKLFIHLQSPMPQITSQNLVNKLKLSRVQMVFCNSEFTKSYVDTEFGIKSRVLYPPVTLAPQKIVKENIILHVGRFRIKESTLQSKTSDFKKQHVMLQQYKKMVDDGLIGWKFVLAVSVLDQDRDAFNTMKELVSKYPVEFLVNQKNNKLWNMYSKAKIYWHASGFGEDLQKHPEAAEHFGISTVEAMGAGAVPVVINAGGQKEIVRDGIDGMVWDTLEDLQEKTLEVIKDKKLWSKLSENAIQRAAFFAGDRFCREVHTIIGE